MLNPKLIFVGSPKFAIPSLNRLLEEFNIMAVITQPDKPAGRGKEMRAPVVKTLAIEKNIEVLQPIKMNDPAIMERIELMEPDLIVVVAFGQLLRKKTAESSKIRCPQCSSQSSSPLAWCFPDPVCNIGRR